MSVLNEPLYNLGFVSADFLHDVLNFQWGIDAYIGGMVIISLCIIIIVFMHIFLITTLVRVNRTMKDVMSLHKQQKYAHDLDKTKNEKLNTDKQAQEINKPVKNSLIRRELCDAFTNDKVRLFLDDEGFKDGHGGLDKGQTFYKVGGVYYSAILSVDIDTILVKIAPNPVIREHEDEIVKTFKYNEYDFDDFKKKYDEAVQFAKPYIRKSVRDMRNG